MDAEPVVFLICDKSKTRKQLTERLERLGYAAEPLGSMEQFHDLPFPTEAGCLLLFLTDPDGDLDWLHAAGPGHSIAGNGHWPVVAISAEADVEFAVTATVPVE